MLVHTDVGSSRETLNDNSGTKLRRGVKQARRVKQEVIPASICLAFSSMPAIFFIEPFLMASACILAFCWLYTTMRLKLLPLYRYVPPHNTTQHNTKKNAAVHIFLITDGSHSSWNALSSYWNSATTAVASYIASDASPDSTTLSPPQGSSYGTHSNRTGKRFLCMLLLVY